MIHTANPTHEHTLVAVPVCFLDPSQPANLRDDEIEMVLVCIECSQVISHSLVAA